MVRKIICGALILLIIINISFISAITGSIGNARMVLRAEKGDIIEKSILVKNVNNVSVEIELSPSGDLADYLDIKDEKFTLSPNDEKKAYFTLKVGKDGTTETKINVKFNPVDEGNGIGLSSTIIVITGEESDWFNNEEETNNEEEMNNNSSFSFNLKNPIKNDPNKKANFAVIIGVSMTVIVFLIFIVVVIIAIKNKRKLDKEIKIKPSKKSVKRHG